MTPCATAQFSAIYAVTDKWRCLSAMGSTLLSNLRYLATGKFIVRYTCLIVWNRRPRLDVSLFKITKGVSEQNVRKLQFLHTQLVECETVMPFFLPLLQCLWSWPRPRLMQVSPFFRAMQRILSVLRFHFTKKIKNVFLFLFFQVFRSD